MSKLEKEQPSNLFFRDILSFPTQYKERQKSVKPYQTRLVNIYRNNNEIIIVGSSSKYQQKMGFYKSNESDELELNTPIRIYCGCPSFNFEFAHILNDENALLNPEEFKIATRKTPKEKNEFSVLTGCKHIISFGSAIYKRLSNINLKISKI